MHASTSFFPPPNHFLATRLHRLNDPVSHWITDRRRDMIRTASVPERDSNPISDCFRISPIRIRCVRRNVVTRERHFRLHQYVDVLGFEGISWVGRGVARREGGHKEGRSVEFEHPPAALNLLRHAVPTFWIVLCQRHQQLPHGIAQHL